MEDAQNVDVTEETTPKEVLAAGGVSRSRRSGGSGHSRYGHRRSPTTGHRVRRNKTPEPDLVTPEDSRQKNERVKRSLSSPAEARNPNNRRISSSEEEEVKKPVKVSKPKAASSKTKLESTKSKLESSKRWSAVPLTADLNKDGHKPKDTPSKVVLRTRSKSRGGGEEKEEKNEDERNSSWWKSWPSFTLRLRGKSLERETVVDSPKIAPPRRNRSLERPPVIKEKEKRALTKKEKEGKPVAKKRSKSSTRAVANEERRPSVEDDSDDFWKPPDYLRKRQLEEKKLEAEDSHNIESTIENHSQELVLVDNRVDSFEKEPLLEHFEENSAKGKNQRFSLRDAYLDITSEWKSFIAANPREIAKLRSKRNRCIASFVIFVMYCGCGALIFRFTEGAFESFYKCGVKRVKRDFVDGLWVSSHNMREDDWKSLARRKLMEFEEQLQTAYEAGMTSYSGLKAWSFLNAFIYCLTVVTTIGYGHISPSTTTGRAITIIYAIFGIPMFLILLADFGKLFTRGIKFIWAFVRRVYYTGSCKKVRRTVPVQEVMKGVQMVYDIATFRRPSQLPPGVTLDEQAPPPLPPRTYTPGEPPGTPALSTYAIDDEFNLPISVAIFILLIYIFCGATVFYVWENWGFFESFYFVFISMSTIGFGDFVPQNQMYMMASIVYLVFGLALTSMCINVVQEKLSDSFRQASAKIGATIGLRVAEEDGTVTPVAPAPVEIAEVHNALSAKSTPTPSAS